MGVDDEIEAGDKPIAAMQHRPHPGPAPEDGGDVRHCGTPRYDVACSRIRGNATRTFYPPAPLTRRGDRAYPIRACRFPCFGAIQKDAPSDYTPHYGDPGGDLRFR